MNKPLDLLNRLYGNPKPIPLLSPQEGVALANEAAAKILELEATFQAEIARTRESAALVVHALNCALQLIEALIAYTTEGTSLHPNVAAAKGALDHAMKELKGR